MKLKAIVASRDLGLTEDVVSQVAATFATTDGDFAVRASTSGVPSSVIEAFVVDLGIALDRRVIKFKPHGQLPAVGRAGTFNRDYTMVSCSSHVLAFFDTDRGMEGGTGHVVKAALDRGIEVEAYVAAPDGRLEYLGSDDSDPDRVPMISNPVLEQMWREVREE